MSLRFDVGVAPGGYAWWYLDAWSDDGRQGLTLIAFVGSVFSPYYALARRRGDGQADPEQHCAVNLALYGSPGADVPRAWCMTERGARHVQRCAPELRIGPSALQFEGGLLTVRIDEVAVPWLRRLRGSIRLRSELWRDARYALDEAGRHQWRPIAPSARIEVDFEEPAMRWEGAAYLDSNEGSRPLSDDFERWDWSRAALPGGTGAVTYDVTASGGGERRLALSFPSSSAAVPLEPSHRQALPRTGWRLARYAASEAPGAANVIQTLEDGPFYARSRVRSTILAQDCVAMHESLSLARWRQPMVQAMLPFRMPRRA